MHIYTLFTNFVQTTHQTTPHNSNTHTHTYSSQSFITILALHSVMTMTTAMMIMTDMTDDNDGLTLAMARSLAI